MKRKIEVNGLYKTREPRPGELNFELKRILTKHCKKTSLKQAVKSIELAVARLAKHYGFDEYECEYDRTTSLGKLNRRHKPWVTESVQVIIFRRRSNRTLSLYRAGASSYPHFFPGPDGNYANLSAPRDISIFYGVDEPYTWEKYYGNPKKIPTRIKRK